MAKSGIEGIMATFEAIGLTPAEKLNLLGLYAGLSVPEMRDAMRCADNTVIARRRQAELKLIRASAECEDARRELAAYREWREGRARL
jgi:hypothetical protein